MQDNEGILSVVSHCEGVPQLMDQNGDEHCKDPEQNLKGAVGRGAKYDRDQPEERVNPDGKTEQIEVKIEACGWGNLKKHERFLSDNYLGIGKVYPPSTTMV